MVIRETFSSSCIPTYSLQSLLLLCKGAKVQLLKFVGQELLGRWHALSKGCQVVPELCCFAEVLIQNGNLQLPAKNAPESIPS